MVRRILMVGVVLLAGGACSSGGDAGDGAAPQAPAASPTSAPPATLAGAVEPAAPDDPYCVALGSIDGIDAVQELAGADPAELAAAVEVARAAVGQMAIVAPEEVRADWVTISSAYTDLFDAFSTSGFDLTVLMANPSASLVFERFGGREVLDAGDRVEQHAEAACGISLGLGRSTVGDDEPALAATGTTPTVAPLGDEQAAEIGRRLLDEFGLSATPEQEQCLGRAVSDPEAVAALTDTGSGLDRYRALAAGCGIDASSLG